MQISKAIDANRVAEARLPELLQIHDLGRALEPDRYGVKGLPATLRRRTRSHNSYKHAKRPRSVAAGDGDERQKMNRRMRRKEQFRKYQGNPFDTSDTAALASTSLLTNVVLPTHIFHAKRMTMRLLFGRFVLAEGLPGKGHGTRSFAHKLSNGCIAHDMSYWCSIEVVLSTGGEAAIKRLVEQSARSRRPLICSSLSPPRTERVTLWAHCAYAEEAVAMVHKLQDVDGSQTMVGRLGRIELRGPRSKHTLENAVGHLKEACPEYEAFDVGEGEDFQGCTVVAPRETYSGLFKAICLNGGVICGQREWHWYTTMSGRRFYPDDYEVDDGMGAEGKDLLPVRVWVRRKGVLEAGMELLDDAGDVVGCISSPKPRLLPNKYCSVGRAHPRLFEADQGGNVKRRLTARPRGSPGEVCIEVTVRLM